MTKHCVLYARLSVTKEESVSIARQLDSGRRLAELRGWTIIGEYVDDGVSATANRPEDRNGFKNLLAATGFDAVIIWKVDRLARKVIDFLAVHQILEARGASLVAVEDPIDMTTPMGKAFATILAVFGEMEAAAISSRIKAARTHMIREGRWPGGGTPYGYQAVTHPNGVGRALAPDPERHPWLTEIIAKARNGTSTNAITTWLTNTGAPLPAGSFARRKTGATSWNRQTVDGILRNPVVAGMTPYNPGRPKSAGRASPFAVLRDTDGNPVVNDALAVISVEEFAVLQELLDARSTPQARKRSEREPTSPFLSRVVTCDACNRYLCRGTNQGRPTLQCPTCRQTMGRSAFDPYLIERLLTERGTQPLNGSTVKDQWGAAGTRDTVRRSILLSQLESLRIRRGVVGRYFDADRVLLTWAPSKLELQRWRPT